MISDLAKALIITVIVISCVVLVSCGLGSTASMDTKEYVCSVKGKATYIYGGREYSCFNGVKVK